jgi:TonB family protein
MFDYAISRSRRIKPTKRIFASWLASAFTHCLLLLLLIEFPQMLRGGRDHQFRGIFGARSESEDINQDWRTVTMLENPERMVAPSAAMLKKTLPKWDNKGSGTEPIRVRFGDLNAILSDLPPMPKAPKEVKKPEISLPENSLAAGASQANQNIDTGNSGTSAGNRDSNSNKKEPSGLTSGKDPKTEISANIAPSKIPDSINPSPNPASSSKSSAGVFENEKGALRSPGIGLFDTRGFPLGDYRDIIVARVKGKWFIPSNLKNSQGQTTIVFYIDKDGRYANARIVASSGNNSLDFAALAAIIESNPFPPLPKGFPGDHIGVKLVLIVEP